MAPPVAEASRRGRGPRPRRAGRCERCELVRRDGRPAALGENAGCLRVGDVGREWATDLRPAQLRPARRRSSWPARGRRRPGRRAPSTPTKSSVACTSWPPGAGIGRRGRGRPRIPRAVRTSRRKWCGRGRRAALHDFRSERRVAKRFATRSPLPGPLPADRRQEAARCATGRARAPARRAPSPWCRS